MNEGKKREKGGERGRETKKRERNIEGGQTKDDGGDGRRYRKM